MIIISQNLTNYDFQIPDNAILRINLAWVSDLRELKRILTKHRNFSILVDLPTKRLKPPHNNYSIKDLIPIIHSYQNIKFFAVSNVEHPKDIEEYIKLIPQNVTIIPKIESSRGIINIEEIVTALHSKRKFVMLDHDDLFMSLVNSRSPSTFIEYVNKLTDYCNENNITLFRTRGVIFSDDEKRINLPLR